MTTSTNYWLARWIDEYAIQNEEDIVRCLSAQSSIQKVIEAIVPEISDPLKIPEVHVHDGAVAGRRVDLSGVLGCGAYECQRKIIDTSFGPILHYFDNVVVEGFSPHRAFEMAKSDPTQFGYFILQHAQTFLYLRRIGAEPFAVFTEKPGLCVDHFNQSADGSHVFSAYDGNEKAKLVSRILRTSTFDIHELPDGWYFIADGPLIHEPLTVYFNKTGKKPTKKLAAENLAERYSGALVTDIFSAQLFRLPLADAGSAVWLTKGRQRNRFTDSDVALQLDLPILNHLDLGTFLKLREDERESFESFRTALTAAISQQLSKGSTAEQVATAVVKEIVAPSLAEIERRAVSSRRVIGKKSALDFSVGTAAAIVGLTESIPLVLTVSAAAIPAALGVAHSHIDERESIRRSDYYFLWRAKKTMPKH